MSNLSDNDVNEATAALKGMLGIGSGSAGPTPSKSAGGKPKGGKQGRKGNQETPKRGSKQNDRSESNPRPGGGSNTKAQQNFAWSAFQASPDASALPIPAFVSPVNSATGDESSAQLDPSQLISLLSRSGDQQLNPVPVEIINAPRAEDLEAQQIAEAEKAKEATPQVESQLDANTQNEQALQEEAKPVSEKGINLAALAASPTSNPQYPPRVHGAGLLAPPPTPFSSPQLPPRYLSHGHFSSPPPQQLPQSYVTMQVQVPPILGPDRRLVVHSPAGYPVQILIPDGVPPGMVIPVHVPTSPMIPSPYYAQHQQQPQPLFILKINTMVVLPCIMAISPSTNILILTSRTSLTLMDT
ncbi:hypothetical protein MHU86_15416 [Fragilaria crotonensis]|nr:hypothetical protein MHU86_15416 [Fragilaria crotonensis]